MPDFFAGWIESTWAMLVDSAFLLMLGLTLAGLLRLFLNEKNINRFVSGNPRTQVFKLALLGIPLPLCSCSVLPVAYQLRQSGISRGGAAAFLIATPESGVDSILLTYSLMDPVMTVARPISAFLAAFTAGFTETLFPDNSAPQFEQTKQTCSQCECPETEISGKKEPIAVRLGGGIKYAFTDLIGDLSVYLLVGYLLAGLVSTLPGPDSASLPDYFVSGWGGYIGALVIGIPLYVCATSSTPLAAALLAAGFSPGAILVFLLVGPATNVASLVLVNKILKGWATVRYLLSIIVVALLCGFAADWLYARMSWVETFEVAPHIDTTNWLGIISAIAVTLLVFRSISKKLLRR